MNDQERERREHVVALTCLIIVSIVVGVMIVLLVRAGDAEARAPKRHASAYLYWHGKPIEPVEKSQAIARAQIVPRAGGHAGYKQPVVIVDLLSTDPKPSRCLWPHAAGIDTVWFGEIPEPSKGERSYALVGREGRGIPDSVRVENGAESLTIPVARRKP